MYYNFIFVGPRTRQNDVPSCERKSACQKPIIFSSFFGHLSYPAVLLASKAIWLSSLRNHDQLCGVWRSLEPVSFTELSENPKYLSACIRVHGSNPARLLTELAVLSRTEWAGLGTTTF